MLFNSLEFLILFLPLTVGVASVLRGEKLLIWICAVSLIFYGFAGHAWFLIPMAVTTCLDFWVGRQLEKSEGARRVQLLLLSLCGNLGLLAYFKYSKLIFHSALAIARLLHAGDNSGTVLALQVILPAGISFYTFQTLSYVIDIYRRQAHAESDFWAYLAFVSFFPHLVAGPLTRHSQLIPQLKKLSQSGIRPQWASAIGLFSVGLCKKVLLADRIGSWIDPMLLDLRHAGLASAWLGVIGYSLQIYFDFSGYSDMAIGLGRLFSVELPQNFNSPYKSTDPSDFWRRWHITLSLWLRDYLYISLGGNRRGPRRTLFNLLATMTLGGLWHGANWTFAIWGLYHGLLLVGYHRFQHRWDRLPLPVRRGATYLAICIGWVFFRADSVGDAAQWLAALVGLHGWSAGLREAPKLAFLVVVGLAICLLTPNPYQWEPGRLRPSRAVLLAVGAAAAVVMMNYSSKFLYFQF